MCKQCEQYPTITLLGALQCRYKTALQFVGLLIGAFTFTALIIYTPFLIQFFATLDIFSDSCGYGFMSKTFGYYLNLYCEV